MWASEHFKRLQMWCGPDVGLPIHPEVLVQGHDWKLKIVSITNSGRVVCFFSFDPAGPGYLAHHSAS